MFPAIRATQRNKFTSSLFSSTFAICVLLVSVNSIIPCPVDSINGNESIVDERIKRKMDEKK